MSVVPEPVDDNVPNLLSVASSSDSFSPDEQQTHKSFVSSAFSNASTILSSPSGSSPATKPVTNDIHVTKYEDAFPKNTFSHQTHETKDLHQFHGAHSSLPEESPEAACQNTEEDAFRDAGNSQHIDEPFLDILLTEADELQRAKGRLERVAPFEESDLNSCQIDQSITQMLSTDGPFDYCSIFQCRSTGIIVPRACEKSATIHDEDLAENDMSTVDGPITKSAADEVFSRGIK